MNKTPATMTIKLTFLFFLFIGYTLACIADGPDVKPLWKKWLGWKLERYANKLKPINYCNKPFCEHVERAMKMPQIHFLSDILEKNILLDEGDMYEATMLEELSRKKNLPLPRRKTRHGMIEEGKEMCIKSISNSIVPYIDIKIDEDSRYPGVIISGRLMVGKKQPL